MNDENIKSVDLIIPCLNEEKHIERCLNSIINNGYNLNHLNIYIIDGISTDETRNIIKIYKDKYKFLRLINNPGANKSRALNKGIKASSSEIIMRVDAHSRLPKNYIERLVTGLIKHNADNFGGTFDAHSDSNTKSQAIGIVYSHWFANGSVWYRDKDKINNFLAANPENTVVEASAVPFGCYRREIFKKIGGFNTKLIRTQDKEFNNRILQQGGRLFIDLSVNIAYRPRTTIWGYIQQTCIGAHWLFYARRFTTTRMYYKRNLAPPAFVIYHLFIILSLLYSNFIALILSFPLITYWVFNLLISTYESARRKNLYYILYLFFLFPATHYGYGVSSLLGWLKARLLPRDIQNCRL